MTQDHGPRATLGRFTEYLSLLAKWHLFLRDILSPVTEPVPFPPGAGAAVSLRQLVLQVGAGGQVQTRRPSLARPWLCLPANPHPVLSAPRLASPRPSSSSTSVQASGRADDTLIPISHQMSSQRLGQPGTPCPPVLTAQDPAGIRRECASWARAQF